MWYKKVHFYFFPSIFIGKKRYRHQQKYGIIAILIRSNIQTHFQLGIAVSESKNSKGFASRIGTTGRRDAEFEIYFAKMGTIMSCIIHEYLLSRVTAYRRIDQFQGLGPPHWRSVLYLCKILQEWLPVKASRNSGRTNIRGILLGTGSKTSRIGPVSYYSQTVQYKTESICSLR